MVSGDLELLDREAIDLLHRAGVRVVGIGDAARPWLGERLTALGADLVAVAPQDEASAGSVVRDALAILGSARDDELPGPAQPEEVAVRRPTEGLVVAVWGPTGAPGRTTVAVNVAAELAAAGRRTLLVDADTYGGCVAQVVGMLDEAPGLAAAARAAGQGTLDLMTLARLTPSIAPDLRVLSGISRADRWPELPVVVPRRRVVGRPRARRVDGRRLRLLPRAGRGAQLRHAGAAPQRGDAQRARGGGRRPRGRRGRPGGHPAPGPWAG